MRRSSGTCATSSSSAQALDGVDVLVHAAAALPSGGAVDGTNVDGNAAARARRGRGNGRHAGRCFVSSAVVYGLRTLAVRARPTSRSRSSRTGAPSCAPSDIGSRSAPGAVVLRPAAFLGPDRLGVFGILFRWVRENRRHLRPRRRKQSLPAARRRRPRGGDPPRGCRRDVKGVLNVGGRVTRTVREDLEPLIRACAQLEPGRGRAGVARARRAAQRSSSLRLSPLSTWHARSADRDFVLDCDRAAERFSGWCAGTLAVPMRSAAPTTGTSTRARRQPDGDDASQRPGASAGSRPCRRIS